MISFLTCGVVLVSVFVVDSADKIVMVFNDSSSEHEDFVFLTFRSIDMSPSVAASSRLL